MTQPDEYFPDDAANAGSLSAFASKTQSEWEAEQRGAEVARWGPLSILARIPIIGDIIEFITGIEDGDLNDIGTWVNSVIGDILRMFGIGAPNDDGGSGTPGTGSFDLFGAIQNFINGILAPGGVVTNETPIPPNLLTPLAPGASPNILPSTATSQMVDGKGQWTWDWPGSGKGRWGSPGVVRTVRPGLITIFWVTGTWQGGASGGFPSPYPDPMTELRTVFSDQFVPPGALLPVPGENAIDWERFEVISVKYPGALYPMGYSVNEGVRELKSLINQIDGQFIILSGSQGGAVASRVYNEIRSGSLQHRDEDFLFGFCFGNMMREQGTGFPDPDGNQVVYCTEGNGILEPTLSGTVGDERWWEWSVPAGTYPAYGELEGITWPHSDPISCLGHSAADANVRLVVDTTMKETTLTGGAGNQFLMAMIGNIIWHPTAMNTILNVAFNVNASSHGNSVWQVQPFLGSHGDERSMWRYVLDYINDTFGPLVSPPTIGMRHQMEGTQLVSVQPNQILRASVPVGWMNVVANGPAITLGVNVYDADGDILAGTTPTLTVVSATISDPQPESNGWVSLSGSFVMPQGAAKACITLDASAEACTTGIVFWDIGNAVFEVTDGLIDASILTNIEGIDPIDLSSVKGIQGQATLLSALQTLIDGSVSAHQQAPATEAELAEFFASQGLTAVQAAQALALAIEHEQKLALVSNKPIYVGLEPTGEATFPLDSLPQGEIMPSTEIPMGETLMGFITSQALADKGFVEFMAEADSATGVYLNVYSLDPDTGDFDVLLWASDDISASIPDGSFGWVGVNIPLEEEFSVPVGEMFACEIVAEGSAVNVVSKTTGMPNKPTGAPPNFGAVRTISVKGRSPSTLDGDDFTYSSTRPYILFGVSNLPATYEPPNQNIFRGSGVKVMPIPQWAQAEGVLFDTVLLGAGASGGPSSFLINPGKGGHCGQWTADTLAYGDDIPLGITDLIVAVGQGGPSGSSASAGGSTRIGYATSVPMFDAVGGGKSASASSFSWDHTATEGAYVIVAVASSSGTSTSATYGGVAMTLLGSRTSSVDAKIWLYGLNGVAGGQKTVEVTFSGTVSGTCNSVSYTGVASATTPETDGGTSGPVSSGAMDVEPGQIAVAAFVAGQGGLNVGGGFNRYDFGKLSISDSNVPTTFAGSYGGIAAWWAGAWLLLEAEEHTTLLSAAGGAINAPSVAGEAAGSVDYPPGDQSRRYFGGQAIASGRGSAPGGGGAGGAPLSSVGNAGADGQAWITMRRP